MRSTAPRVLVIMGVSGSGKTTIGQLLATRHEGHFFDADDFHSPENITKMSAGKALNDDDRKPWLECLKAEVIDKATEGKLTLLACSALKKSYRETLGLNETFVSTVFLSGNADLLLARLGSRSGHYMKSNLLDSQLAALEIPSSSEAFHVSISNSPDQIVEMIEDHFQLV